MLAENTKACSKCDKEKPFSAFYIDLRYNRPFAECRACHKARHLEYRRRDARHGVTYERRRLWSALDDARLMALCSIGLDVSEISKLLGRRKEIIWIRADRLASEYPGAPEVAPRRRWSRLSPDFINEVRRLVVEEGLSYSWAAAELRVSPGVIAGTFRRHINPKTV